MKIANTAWDKFCEQAVNPESPKLKDYRALTMPITKSDAEILESITKRLSAGKIQWLLVKELKGIAIWRHVSGMFT